MPPLNTLEYAKIYQAQLDKQAIQIATSGWMEPNSSQVRYNGGDEVRIPKLDMDGLGDYDRDDGFVQGSATLVWQTKTLTQDRGRTFQIDPMDVDETAFVPQMGTIMGEFQREKVIPEIDAYRYSKIATYGIANSKNKAYTPAAASILKELQNDIADIQDITGNTTDLVITMAIPVLNILNQSTELSRTLTVTDFAQGGIQTKVSSINGIPIIPVVSARMKTEYQFLTGGTGQKGGGFKPGPNALGINWIICPRRMPIAISKTDVIRFFDPMTNQRAHAWRADYRKYHDLWILDNQMPGLRVSLDGTPDPGDPGDPGTGG